MGSTNDIYLSLGSNLGDRMANLDQAIKELKDSGAEILQRSSIYKTAAWGDDNLQEFLNMAVRIQHHAKPLAVLDEIKSIELKMGRAPLGSIPDGPRQYQDRIIDIDLLYYGHEVLDSELLSLPHPRLHQRGFVLEPLREIAPEFVHPLFKKTTIELYKACSDQNKVELYA